MEKKKSRLRPGPGLQAGLTKRMEGDRAIEEGAKEGESDEREKNAKKKKKRHQKLEGLLSVEDPGAAVDVEVCLLKIRECFVYSVGSRKGTTGYFCKSWGLENPLWSGSLHIMMFDDCLKLVMLKNKQIFCESAPIPLREVGVKKPLSAYIESCVDSSRYFVVRVMDPMSKRVVHLGIGFRERSEAFDFNATISDRLNMIQRQVEVERGSPGPPGVPDGEDSQEDKGDEYVSLGLKGLADLNIGKDSKFTIVLKNRTTKTKDTGEVSESSSGLLLPPPPRHSCGTAETDETDDSEWGDFTSCAS